MPGPKRPSPLRRQRSAALVTTLALVGGAWGASLGASPAAAAPDQPWSVPVPPPICTDAQIDDADVADCLLYRWGYAGDRGFGYPPAPGVGEGWEWSGFSYSGSPALAGFESVYIGANADAIGTIPTGSLQIHVAAQVLFEGFLAGLQDGGYEIRHVGGYTFRCTGTWDCPSGDVDDLSLHAFGLAIDMNSDANPIATYGRTDGASACLTPIVTDFPQWAIELAEQWGLYWGGYGWTSGCNVAGVDRNSVVRDTPHFEFRGTPEQAWEIYLHNTGQAADPEDRRDPSFRCLDVVDATGADTEVCNADEVPQAGWRLPVSTGSTHGAPAAVINLTATGADGPGYLTLESCGPTDAGAERSTSTLTFTAGESVAATAVVPLDDDGRFCVFRSTAVDSVVDVVGYLLEPLDDEPVQWLLPDRPERVLDTRRQQPLAALDVRPIPASAERPATGTTTPTAGTDRLVNLAAVAHDDPGYLQAGGCDVVGQESVFSNLNYRGHTGDGPAVRSNLALVRDDGTGSCVFSLSDAEVIVDELARLHPTDGLGWQVGEAERVLDTRECDRESCPRPSAGELIEVPIDGDAPMVAVAITVTDTAADGYVSVGSCDRLADELAADGEASTSNLNHLAGQTVTNLALVNVVDGRLCAYTRSPAHVVLDVQAHLVDDQTLGLIAIDPIRLHDSRDTR